MERKENKHIESRQSWKQALKSILPKRIIEKLIILRYKNKNNWFSIGKKRLLLIDIPMSGHQYYQIGDLKKYYLDFELSNGLSKSDLYSKSLLSILNNSVTFNSTPAFDLTEQAKLIHGTIESFDKQVLKHIKS